MIDQVDDTNPSRHWRDFTVLFATWLVLAAISVLFAKQNLSVPGLYYDEAVFAGLAKDFVTGQVHGQHMPDHQIITLGGRPFPLFVQTYLGALKSWMLIPAFRVFGPTVSVLRGSNLLWQSLALLFLMLASWRWLGLAAALIAGALLVFDPTFIFISVLDWGVAVASFLCRCACLYFAVRWSWKRKFWDAFLFGLFAGLGFFNKADFAVFLVGAGFAAAVCYWKELLAGVRREPSAIAFAALGFALGGGPMLLRIPRMLAITISGPHPNAPGEFGVKLRTMLSMYDGSYFYRLMNVGGVFERMYDGASGPGALIGLALIVACVVFIGFVYQKKSGSMRALTFSVIAAGLVTLGVFALPDAVRIHHAFLVYPLPQLIIASVAGLLWKRSGLIRGVLVLAVAIICGSALLSIGATERLIRDTGGRGRWSESLDAFCHENRNRSDLTIVSLDWGFNEQLMFLTDGPQLAEPFWQFNQTLPPLLPEPNYLYLAHPAEYSVLNYDVGYLNQLRNNPNAEITPHLDRQGQVAFYTIRFRSQ